MAISSAAVAPVATAVVGTFFAALGDTLGVTGLIEGVTGKRLLTGTQLTSSQAGESLGSGAASVAAMVAGPALVKTIKPVVSKIVEPVKTAVANAATTVKNAVGSLFSKINAGLKALAGGESPRKPAGLNLQLFAEKPEPPVNIRKVNGRYLEQQGVDAHAVKADVVGKKNVARYDIYEDKDTGSLWVFGKGGKGEGIPTGLNFGRR